MVAFTRTKLAEAEFFLDRLPETADNSDIFYYQISAFLTAWRSTLDIMLYDFADRYPLRFTREDDISRRDFKIAARAINNSEALRFIDWWESKQSILGSTPLWKKRNINLHRGSIPLVRTYTILASGSGGTSGTVSLYSSNVIKLENNHLFVTPIFVPNKVVVPVAASKTATSSTQEWHFDDIPDENAIDICKQAYNKMEEIVKEAEASFGVNL